MKRFLHTIALTVLVSLLALSTAALAGALRSALESLKSAVAGMGVEVEEVDMFARLSPVLFLIPLSLIIAVSAAYAAVYMYRERR